MLYSLRQKYISHNLNINISFSNIIINFYCNKYLRFDVLKTSILVNALNIWLLRSMNDDEYLSYTSNSLNTFNIFFRDYSCSVQIIYLFLLFKSNHKDDIISDNNTDPKKVVKLPRRIQKDHQSSVV